MLQGKILENISNNQHAFLKKYKFNYFNML